MNFMIFNNMEYKIYLLVTRILNNYIHMIHFYDLDFIDLLSKTINRKQNDNNITNHFHTD